MPTCPRCLDLCCITLILKAWNWKASVPDMGLNQGYLCSRVCLTCMTLILQADTGRNQGNRCRRVFHMNNTYSEGRHRKEPGSPVSKAMIPTTTPMVLALSVFCVTRIWSYNHGHRKQAFLFLAIGGSIYVHDFWSINCTCCTHEEENVILLSVW